MLDRIQNFGTISLQMKSLNPIHEYIRKRPRINYVFWPFWVIWNSNKPENPFQNYELAKNIRRGKEIFMFKKYIDITIQKPETGQKTGPRTTGKILCANEPVWQKKFSYINLFSKKSTKAGNQTVNRIPDLP